MKPKRLLSMLIILTTLFSSLSFSAFAKNASYAWFIRRNGNNQPELCKEQEIIYKYGAYYLDRRLKDRDSERVIYLTYDAGYENGNIEKTLNILKEENVPAAFFILDGTAAIL